MGSANSTRMNRYYIIVPLKYGNGKTEHMNYYMDAPSGKILQEFLNKQDIFKFFKMPEQIRPAVKIEGAHVYRHITYGAYSYDLSEKQWVEVLEAGEYNGRKNSEWGITGEF